MKNNAINLKIIVRNKNMQNAFKVSIVSFECGVSGAEGYYIHLVLFIRKNKDILKRIHLYPLNIGKDAQTKS